MTLDLDKLAADAVAPLKGRVLRREVQERVASAVIVALDQVLAEAALLLSADRIVQALSIRRHLGATTLKHLRAELADIQRDVRNLRPKSCSETASGGRAGALSPPASLSAAP